MRTIGDIFAVSSPRVSYYYDDDAWLPPKPGPDQCDLFELPPEVTNQQCGLTNSTVTGDNPIISLQYLGLLMKISGEIFLIYFACGVVLVVGVASSRIIRFA